MADTLTKSERSKVMACVRSRGNRATELRFIRILRTAGIKGWRRHQKVFGSPDFVFRSHRIAVFVDGCFWHGCPKHCRAPKSNIAFWRRKITRNKERALLVKRTLRKKGWRVLRIWEHELKHPNRCLARLLFALSLSSNAVNRPNQSSPPGPS